MKEYIEEPMLFFDSEVKPMLNMDMWVITFAYPVNGVPPKDLIAPMAQIIVAYCHTKMATREEIFAELERHNIPEVYWDWALDPWKFPTREPNLKQRSIHANEPPDPPYTGH